MFKVVVVTKMARLMTSQQGVQDLEEFQFGPEGRKSPLFHNWNTNLFGEFTCSLTHTRQRHRQAHLHLRWRWQMFWLRGVIWCPNGSEALSAVTIVLAVSDVLMVLISGDSSCVLLESYRQELKLKQLIQQELAHTVTSDLCMVYLSCWLHQPFTPPQTRLTLEALLLETGHRPLWCHLSSSVIWSTQGLHWQSTVKLISVPGWLDRNVEDTMYC